MTTDPEQFKLFHECITKNHPDYTPFYFPLKPNSKDPLEGISWKKNRATFEQAVKYLEMGYNVGIAATDNDQLVIMDKDNIETVGVTKPTLTVTSRKRIGEHCYYFTSDKVPEDIFEDSAKQNIATEEAGEIRSVWQYVVCPGSYVPVKPEELERIPDADRINAGRYTIKIPTEANQITFQEFPDVYIKCLTEKRETEISKKIKNESKGDYDVPNDKHKSALFNLTIENVTGKNDDGSHRFPSLFHGSATGMNTSVRNGLLLWRQ